MSNCEHEEKERPTKEVKLPPEEEAQLPEQIKQYQLVFAAREFDILPKPSKWDHKIELTPGDHKITTKAYPMNVENAALLAVSKKDEPSQDSRKPNPGASVLGARPNHYF